MKSSTYTHLSFLVHRLRFENRKFQSFITQELTLAKICSGTITADRGIWMSGKWPSRYLRQNVIFWLTFLYFCAISAFRRTFRPTWIDAKCSVASPWVLNSRRLSLFFSYWISEMIIFSIIIDVEKDLKFFNSTDSYRWGETPLSVLRLNWYYQLF